MYRNSLNAIDSSDQVYINTISSSDTYHPELTSLVGLYVNILNKNLSYVIPIDHSEKIDNITTEEIVNKLGKVKELYCIDKKTILYFLPLKNLRDVKFGTGNFDLPVSSYFTWIYSKNRDYIEINKIIPLEKHLERHDEEVRIIRQKIDQLRWEEGEEFFNSIACPVFNLIERHGLRIIYKPFLELFKPNSPDLNIKDNVVYTFYNLYNITSRPTNAFNSINFLAIPKKPEYRRCIIPQFDTFVEFDFDGYHLRLIAEQVGYELTGESAHTQIGKLLLGVEDLTQEQYAEVKQINFQAIYGNTPEQYKNFTFFKLVEEWIHKLWVEFSTNGSVYSPYSNKRFDSSIEGLYPKKLFNYMIQSMETGRNILALKNTLQYLKDKKTKIALYTYDSVLFDFCLEDGKQTLLDLENILGEGGKYPVKFKYSKDLVFD